MDHINEYAERDPFWAVVLVLRIPIIVAAIFCLAVSDLLAEGIALETVRYAVLDQPQQLWLLAALLILAGLGVRYCCEVMIDLVAPVLRVLPGVRGWIVGNIPRLVAAAFGVATGVRFIAASFDPTAFGSGVLLFGDVNAHAAMAGAGYLAMGTLAGGLPTAWFSRGADGIGLRARIRNLDWVTLAHCALLFSISLGVFFLFADWTNVSVSLSAGAFGVLAAWAFSAVMYFSPVALLSHVTRLPLLLGLCAAALSFSALNLNDNHEFRLVQVSQKAAGPVPMYFERDLSLKQWLKAREPLDLYDYDHYPIFIVAAEGGGLRAAYFTNRVLKTLQTICPSFAMHTIAISGVSGGSVGAVNFAAQVDRGVVPRSKAKCEVFSKVSPWKATGQVPFEDDLQVAYGQDHLAALLGATLFPDALQRLLPVPIPAFDRARAIECSFEQSAFLAHRRLGKWTPCSDRSILLGDLYSRDDSVPGPPHLILNTTSAGWGAPVPIVTRRFTYTRIGTPVFLATDNSVQGFANGMVREVGVVKPQGVPWDIPLVSAAFLSARFPFVLPPARFAPVNANAVLNSPDRLMDGGLVEDSGTWMAEQVARSLLAEIDAIPRDARDPFSLSAKNAHLYMIVVRSQSCTFPHWPAVLDHLNNPAAQKFYADSGLCPEDVIPNPDVSGFAELWSPLQALFNARISRGYDSQHSLRRFAEEHGSQVSFSEIRFFSTRDARLPLTWTLSREARRRLDEAVAVIPASYWPEEKFRSNEAEAFLAPSLSGGGVTRDGEPILDSAPFHQIVCALLKSRGEVYPDSAWARLPTSCSYRWIPPHAPDDAGTPNPGANVPDNGATTRPVTSGSARAIPTDQGENDSPESVERDPVSCDCEEGAETTPNSTEN